MAEELNPKRLKPEHLAILAKLINAKSGNALDPEQAFAEALEFAGNTLSILRNETVHSSFKKATSINSQTLIDTLVEYMEESGKGATEIGRELNVNRATVTLWRSGKGRPGKKARARLTKYLADQMNNRQP